MNNLRKWFRKHKLYILIADAVMLIAASVIVFTTEKPAAATGLEITGSTYCTVDLSWDKADNAGAYQIYRSTDGENFKIVKSTRSTKYRDKRLRTGRTYYYAITSQNGFRKTDIDKESALQVTPKLDKPRLKIDTSDGEMRLSMSKIDGATGYVIIRDGEIIDRVPDTSYVDERAKGDKSYDYEVRAYRYNKKPVYSKFSNKVDAELHALRNFRVEPIDDDLLFTWDRTDHYSKFKIYNGEELLAETTEPSYRISGYELGKLYDIKVIGFSDDEEKQSPEKGRRFEVEEHPMDNEGAIDAAIEWGVQIADDDSFTYGTGQRAHRYGCYFCETNVGPRKNLKGASTVGGHSYAKTYCCNPFVTACFAHGAGDEALLRACRSGKGVGLTPGSFTKFGGWEEIKKPAMDDLVKGDVLITAKHVMLYMGDGQIVHARREGWDSDSITVSDLSSKRYGKVRYVMHYTGSGSGVRRVIKDLRGNEMPSGAKADNSDKTGGSGNKDVKKEKGTEG